MTDVEDVRAQLYAKKQQEEKGNKMFLILLALVPVLGIAAGIGWKVMDTPPGQSEQIQVATVEVEAERSRPRMTEAEKWLIAQANENSHLALAMTMKEEYPELLEIEKYRVVRRVLGSCALDYREDQGYAFVNKVYIDANKSNYAKVKELADSSGSRRIFLDASMKMAQRELMGMVFNQKEYQAFLSDIVDEINSFDGGEPSNASGECQMVKSLAQRMLLNVKI